MTNDEMHGLLERITAVTRDLWDASSVNVPSDPLEWNRKFRAAAMQLEGAAALIRQHASDHPSMEEKDKGPFGWQPPCVVAEAWSHDVPESWTKSFREWLKKSNPTGGSESVQAARFPTKVPSAPNAPR